MKCDPWSRRRLVQLLGAVSLLLAIGLIGGGFGGVSLANAQQADKKTDMKMEMATTGIFDGVGEIIALLPEKTQVVVGHEEIKGFMKAMPMGMGYDVESLDLLKGLKPGDRVKFKVDAGKKKFVSIEPLQ